MKVRGLREGPRRVTRIRGTQGISVSGNVRTAADVMPWGQTGRRRGSSCTEPCEGLSLQLSLVPALEVTPAPEWSATPAMQTCGDSRSCVEGPGLGSERQGAPCQEAHRWKVSPACSHQRLTAGEVSHAAEGGRCLRTQRPGFESPSSTWELHFGCQ